MTTAINRIGVVGSGIMACGIAEVAARSGFDVTLRSRSDENAKKAVGKLTKSLDKQVEKGKLSEQDRDGALGRVTTTSDLREMQHCDLVVESIVEDLELKRQLFADLDRICNDDAILATNTSTLPVVELAAGTQRPDRVCGFHFFNPAPVMSLVEVVPALTTSEETVRRLEELATDLGKEPVVAKDEAGFIVNALLFPYLNRAVHMLENGTASAAAIDSAMKGGCGFPMGPFELLDLVGIDVSLSILQVLYDERRDPDCAPAPLLKRMVAAGHLGRKSGQGFHDYGDASSNGKAGDKASSKAGGKPKAGKGAAAKAAPHSTNGQVAAAGTR